MTPPSPLCVEVEESLLERASAVEARLSPEAAEHAATCLRCAELVTELTRVREALSAAPGEPSPSLGERLLARVRGDDRFADLVPDVARLFDVDEAEARRLVALVRDDSAWMDGPVPGAQMIPIEGGPRIAGALAGFVRLPPGVMYPAHVHRGTEENLVLQGGFREDNGDETWAGEWCPKHEGTQHHFVALDGPDCITAAVILGEVDFLEENG